MIQVRSRGNASHFAERKLPSLSISPLVLKIKHQADKYKQNMSMICFVSNDLLYFCSVFKATPGNKGSGLNPSCSRDKQESGRRLAGATS